MLSRFSSIGLGTRIIALALSALLLMPAVNDVIFTKPFRPSAQAALIEQAAALPAVADEARNHTAALNREGVLETEKLLADLRRDLEAGLSYRDARIFNLVPVVAGWKSAQKAAECAGITAAAEEQSAAGDEVSRGVQAVSAGISEASEVSQQSAIAVTQLLLKAEQLQEIVQRFKLHADD